MRQTKHTRGASDAPAGTTPERDQQHRCCCCGRMLPLTEFYVNARTLRHDSRCKECRRESSRLQRTKNALAEQPARHRPYPVITEVADPAQRMALIRHALNTVRERSKGKR